MKKSKIKYRTSYLVKANTIAKHCLNEYTM